MGVDQIHTSPSSMATVKMTRKILLIHHGGGIGGAPVSMLQMAAALDRTRFEPLAVFTESGPILDFAEELGVPARVVPMRSAFFYGAHVPVRPRMLLRFVAGYAATVKAARALVREEEPDLVHLNTSVLIPTAVGVKSEDVPVVWHVREAPGPTGWLRRRMISRIQSLADHIVATSEFAGRYHGGGTPVTVIHNTLDTQRFSPRPETERRAVRDELGLPQDAQVVGMIGSVQKVKGHFVLAEAAVRVAREVPDVRFLIVGGGSHRATAAARARGMLGQPRDNLERLRRTIRRSGLESRFVFSGFRTDIPAVVSAMDVLAFPSLAPEGFGRPLIEAMAMALPVVATDVGPTREITGPDSAVLVPPGGPAHLGEALIALLKDERRRREMGEAGRRRFLEHFEIGPAVRRVEDVYDSLAPEPEPSDRSPALLKGTGGP